MYGRMHILLIDASLPSCSWNSSYDKYISYEKFLIDIRASLLDELKWC